MTKRAKKQSKGLAGSSRQSVRQQQSTKGGDGSICRVCARWDTGVTMVPIFERTIRRDVSLAHAISLVGSVDIADNQDQDGMPRQCCGPCLRRVDAAYKLRQQCQESDRKLRDMYPNVAVKQEQEEVDNPLEPMMELVCKPELPDVEEEEEELAGVVEPEPVFIKKEELVRDGEQEMYAVKDEHEDVQEDGDFAMDSDGLEENEEVDAAKNVTDDPSELNENNCFEIVPAVDFRCCGCKRRFPTEEELNNHSQAVHEVNRRSALELGNKVQCDICYKTLFPKAKEEHMQRTKLDYRCKTCGETFIAKIKVICHYQRAHGPNAQSTWYCCGCTESFDSKEELATHSEVVHLPARLPLNEERPFECNNCYRAFKTHRDLCDHQKLQYKRDKKFQCFECGKQYRHPGGLADHEKTHLDEKVWKCDQCPKEYRNRDSYRKHLLRHQHPKGQFQCEQCGRRYRSLKAKREHMLLHTGERPFSCHICPRTFVRDTSLAAHLKMHNGQKDHVCGLCGKRFSCSSNLMQHVNFIHERAKPFPCFFCERRYPRKDYRKRHMLSAHAAELAANPVPAIELSGSRQWVNDYN